MSAQEFMEMLFRKLLAAELRNLCSEPSTRKSCAKIWPAPVSGTSS
jgi:hypothetical protein